LFKRRVSKLNVYAPKSCKINRLLALKNRLLGVREKIDCSEQIPLTPPINHREVPQVSELLGGIPSNFTLCKSETAYVNFLSSND